MTRELQALERLMADYYEMCQDLGNNDDQYQRCNLTSERAIIETALKKQEQDKKKVKALEIIKRSPVMVICEIYKCAIELKMSYEEYCEMFPDEEDRSIKSKEEYDLLTEVLK